MSNLFHGRRVKEAFSGSTNTTKNFSESMNIFEISNDGATNLTFTINGITITVKPGESFFDMFEPFYKVDIVTTSAFRAYGKG